MYNISFPNLNLFFDINPVAFSFGNLSIYWYGIIIACAVITGLIFCRIQSGKYEIKYDTVEEFILWAIPIGIICARLYYVAFSWDTYRDNFAKIFAIWEGGLAIYGGIIGAILVAVIFSKMKKINLLNLCDYCIPFLALGQAMGRWGNFVNREAYGAVTDSFLRMELLQNNGTYISVHPTFLYESFGLVLIFVFLQVTKRHFEGEKIAFYFLGYGILRAIIEWLRTDSLMLLNIKVSMALSILLALVAMIYIILKKCKKNNTDI